MRHTVILRVFTGIIGVLVLCVVGLYATTTESKFGTPAKTFEQLGGDFTLQSDHGEISLSDFTGKAVVLYFGFLSCPVVCPNSMSVISRALGKLSDAQLEQVQAILVSVDPERDTPQALAAYLSNFHRNIVGVTGTDERLNEIVEQYGVYRTIKQVSGIKKADVKIEHSSRYYVINRSGKLVDAMRHSTTANELAARLISLI